MQSGISDYFKRTKDQNAKIDSEEATVRGWLKRFFGSRDFSLRRIAKGIHHLGLVFASLRSDQRSFAITAVVALIVRTADSELYYNFVRGEATDLDVVNRVLERNPGLRELRKQHAGHMFEAMIILAGLEVSGDDRDSFDSPLWNEYKRRIGDESLDPMVKRHARGVIRCLETLFDGRTLQFGTVGNRFGFMHSVQRLELLSPSLIRGGAKAAFPHS